VTDKIKFEPCLEYSNLTISSADAESLLAMKLTSARFGTHDMEDSIFLMTYLNIETEKELFNILDTHVDPFLRKVNVKHFTKEAFHKYTHAKALELEKSTQKAGGIYKSEHLDEAKGVSSNGVISGIGKFIEDIKAVPITKLAEDYGKTLVQKGRRYISLKEHDSVMIDTDKNCFWRNSKFSNKGSGGVGSCIDFAIEFGGYSNAKDAINGIAEAYGIVRDKSGVGKSSNNVIKSISKTIDAKMEFIINPIEEKTKTLLLPPKGKDSKAVFHYLIKDRNINLDVVRYMHSRRMLYEDDKKNCVFVSDKFACIRGTSVTNRFVSDVPGSDYNESFYIRCNTGAKSLVVSESVIDAMSIMSQFSNVGG